MTKKHRSIGERLKLCAPEERGKVATEWANEWWGQTLYHFRRIRDYLRTGDTAWTGAAVNEMAKEMSKRFPALVRVIETLQKGKQMKITLYHEVKPEGEALEWTTEHPLSSYNLGVILMANGEVLSGADFSELVKVGQGRIECDSLETRKKVIAALGIAVMESAKMVRVAE